MCGLAGYVGPDTDSQRSRVATMAEAIAHRGPDDAGIWADGNAILAHRRLSIIDTSTAGHQPMVSLCGRYALVYNGELYNFVELRRELEGRGVAFHSHSDSEVLLAAFATWGSDCVSRFNGMWAFAIWDRQLRRLFISRDRFGEKPFYYVIRDGAFWFASEIKALLAAGIAGRSVNPRAVADFAAERVSDHTEETFFADVRQLPPASCGWFENARLKQHRYWELPADEAAPVNSNFADEIGALLEDSVRLRLRSDVDVGVLLSGGLDSSSVSCLAAKFSDRSVASFSTIDKQPPEEAAGIDAVLAAHRSLRPFRDEPGDDCLDQELEQCLWHQEEPFADGSMLAHFRLMRLVRASGIRVLLSGQGADEVFAGYPGFFAMHIGGLLRHGRVFEVATFMRALSSSGQSLPWAGTAGYTLPSALRAVARRRRIRRDVDWLAADYQDVSDGIVEGYASSMGDPVNDALRACLSQRTLPGFLHYEDRNSMAFGVEVRAPFLDHRLVEKVLPIPGSVKLSGARTKALLRDAVAGITPAMITSRLQKQGYPAPLSRWLRAAPKIKQSQRLELVSACPMIDFAQWSARYKRFIGGDDSQLVAVWRGLILALWHKSFIERFGQ